jgi:hypothetical protein
LEEEVVLNQALARELGAAAGSVVTLHLPKVLAIPPEAAPVAQRDASEVLEAVKLTVRAVLPDEGAGRFNLNPSAEPARNAFVPLRMLQANLEQPGRVNALLVEGASASLADQLRHHLTLDDWGLSLHEPRYPDQTTRGYLSLESRQLLLEPAVEEAALAAAHDIGLRPAPTLVYLANTIANGAEAIPYSVVAALDPTLPPPLGPFLPVGEDRLKDDEIVLADWKESPLKVQPGDPIKLFYFKPEQQSWRDEAQATFRLRDLVSVHGAADDPNLTPKFPGITDRLTIRDWKPPFPYDNSRVKKRDEDYWKRYRTTPKAYVTLAKGQELWGSRFGRLTSIRLAPVTASQSQQPADLSQAADSFRRALLEHLQPEQGGFVFDNVRRRGLEASVGGPDFNLYFPGFSAFLIISALLLVGLLFRLNLDRRVRRSDCCSPPVTAAGVYGGCCWPKG